MLGQIPRKHAFRGSIPFTVWAASPVHSSSLPFCVRFNEAVTSHAATLDTGPRARSYPGGGRTHLSMKHFQFARRVGLGLCDLGRSSYSRLPSVSSDGVTISRPCRLFRNPLSEPDVRRPRIRLPTITCHQGCRCAAAIAIRSVSTMRSSDFPGSFALLAFSACSCILDSP